MFFCGSFSSEIKRKIKKKAKNLSELSGENSRPLSCAHLRHQGGRPPNKHRERPSNGRLVTDIEHLVHHEIFEGMERLIGLSSNQNKKSIEELRNNVEDYNYENNIREDIFETKYQEAQKKWIELYDKNPKCLVLSTKKKDEVVEKLILNAERRNAREAALQYSESEYSEEKNFTQQL